MKTCKHCLYYREMKPKTENTIIYIPAGVCDFWFHQVDVVDRCSRFIEVKHEKSMREELP